MAWETLKHKTVVTRKEQKCSGCARKMPKGSKLDYIVAVDNGDFCHHYLCHVCEETIKDWDIYEWGPGDIRQEGGESWEENRTKFEGEDA